MKARGLRFHMTVMLVVLLALLLQTVVLARIGLPLAGPDLLLLVVIGVGLATGSNYGAITGFAAGLAADIMPPDLTTMGTTALILALVGYLAGSVPDPRGLALLQRAGLIAGLAALAGTGMTLLAWLLGDRSAEPAGAGAAILAYTGYNLVVGMLLVPVVVAWLRRVAGGRRPVGRHGQGRSPVGTGRSGGSGVSASPPGGGRVAGPDSGLRPGGRS